MTQSEAEEYVASLVSSVERGQMDLENFQTYVLATVQEVYSLGENVVEATYLRRLASRAFGDIEVAARSGRHITGREILSGFERSMTGIG